MSPPLRRDATVVDETIEMEAWPKRLSPLGFNPLFSPVGWLTDGDNDTRYYVLIAACVLAQKSVWIRNACLAAALLLPAVAAVHAIVLAALHVDGK